MNKTKLVIIACIGFAILNGCGDDDTTTPTVVTEGNLNLSISGLEDLGDEYAYEGWLIVNGDPVSAGTFTVDADGNLSQTSFEMNLEDLEIATKYVLTIEPSPDSDPTPSKVHLLAGDFSDNSASLTIGHETAFGTDFTSATATYVLRTPTDDGDAETNFQAGVWWLLHNEDGETADCCTYLPELPEGWNYEGWAVVDGMPLSTGIFVDGEVEGVNRRDSYSDRDINNNADPALATGFNGTEGSGPNYPGEDFIQNLPTSIATPVDLRGKKVVITVEPYPDNDPAHPFTLKPLVHDVPADAGLEDLMMENHAIATNPTGTVTR